MVTNLSDFNKNLLISDFDFNLILGAKPPAPFLSPIAYKLRKEIFDWVKKENLEYRYINGSCEDRAHYICLLLQNKGIETGKIWNFAPARYTFASNELFNIKDPFSISEQVTWGYHVAPYLLSFNQDGAEEIIVIDQSFDEKACLTLDQWLNAMKCPQSLCLFTNKESYLFNSIFGDYENVPFSFETHYNLPVDLPSVITGNFWILNNSDDYVQKGLAINDLAVEISKIIRKSSTQESNYLRRVLTDIEAVILLTQSPKPFEISSTTFSHLIKFYFDRYSHWGTKVTNLRFNF
jgi:hypothetical protein